MKGAGPACVLSIETKKSKYAVSDREVQNCSTKTCGPRDRHRGLEDCNLLK